MASTPDLSVEFANFVASARYEDLPTDAVEAAKKSILDTLGVTLAASGVEPAVRGVIDMVLECGGRPESLVLGFGQRVPAAMAALANGAMAHCLDFDDQTPWGAHAASSAVTAAWVLAERKGGVSGRRLITAVAIAQDLFARLRCHVGWRQDWNLSSVVGVFSATAAAAHVLGLDREKVAHAFGIASMQSCGTMETIFGQGTDLRGMYAGFAAQGAVTAALLAERGVTGIASLFEGRAGIFQTYFGGTYDRAKMLENLGKDYTGASTLYKYWPVVGNAHTYIHATIELMKENRLSMDDVEQIRVYVGDFSQRMCAPLEVRRAPTTLVDAKFSLPFCVAVAAVRGGMTIADFRGAALRDPQVLAAAAKVVPVADERYDWKMRLPDGRVEIRTRDGRTVERVGDKVPGSLEAPLTWDQITEKFRHCSACAAVPPPLEKIHQAQEMARQLESLDDATDLLRLLA